MRRILNVFLMLLLFATITTAQTCPNTPGTGGSSAVRWLNSGLFTINWQTSGDATTMFGALAATGTAISVSSPVTGNFSWTLAALTNPSGSGRIRPASSSDYSGSGQFTGTITFFLASGSTVVCEYIAGVLPVEISSFYTEVGNKNIHLKWTTESEINADYMTVQKSLDGKTFFDLGTVRSEGDSYSRRSYEVLDDSPLPLNYYRIKAVDHDGSFDYSNVIKETFDINKTISLSVYPNPASGEIFVSNTLNEGVKVYNVNGQLINLISQQIDNNTLSFDISAIPSGIYLAKSNKSNVATRFIVCK